MTNINKPTGAKLLDIFIIVAFTIAISQFVIIFGAALSEALGGK